jgi:cysteinyl-tRNA synthetase
VHRATEVTGGVEPTLLCADFEQAMDDDLAVPAALAALHEVVREGNKLLADGDSPALRGTLGSVRAMLRVLGLDPLDPAWGGPDDAGGLRDVVDALVGVALEQRTQARARKDFAAADAVRDSLRAAGVLVEDTPQGPRWTLEGEA